MQITVRADVSPQECRCGSVSVAIDGIKTIDIDLAGFQAKKEEYLSQPSDAVAAKTEVEEEKKEEENEEESAEK